MQAAPSGQLPFPPYIYLPQRLGHYAGYDINGQYAGWLGKAYDPMATAIRKRHPQDNPFFRDCSDRELDFRLTGLDPLGRKRMCDAVAARAERGSAVLISSHQLEIIERLCSRFMIIHQGRTRLEGSLAEIRTGLGSFEDVFLSVTGTEDDREAEPA